jgi:SAM-dependent methyltransferase
VPGDFEKLYLQLRQKEGRVYSDEEVANLPGIRAPHPHSKEWELRRQSSQKLIDYLNKRKKESDILEIGCGNGWLAAKLSALKGSMVTAIDINSSELAQARRVFKHIPNLQFSYGSIHELVKMEFDVIVLAASIQYFATLEEVLMPALKCLGQHGEIHIIDSHFYSGEELVPARQRTGNYFESAGFPEMAKLYFHHSLAGLDQFNYSIMYDPHSLYNRFLRKRNPFYWIRIRK